LIAGGLPRLFLLPPRVYDASFGAVNPPFTFENLR
jgi:hypothetical protein